MESDFDATIDYYKILGVQSTASIEEIKQTHIQLALKYHPDVNKTINVEQYRDIQSAYNILSKPEIRAMYDMSRRKLLNIFDPAVNVKASQSIDTGRNNVMLYETQRILFKETQKNASSNWRELKDKYKSEQWQSKDLAFKKVS